MRVFISYHSPDRQHALQLRTALVTRRQDLEVFIDTSNLIAGEFWQPAIFEAINSADAFVMLIGSRLGDWQLREYYEASDRKARQPSFALIPILKRVDVDVPSSNLPGLAQLHWISTDNFVDDTTVAAVLKALDGANSRTPEPAWKEINPYRGLASLEEQDSDFFFGRERETDAIISAIGINDGRAIALIGSSGVGKSSLMRAGVISSLKRQHGNFDSARDSRSWSYITIRPGRDPLSALVAAFSNQWHPEVTSPQRVVDRNNWIGVLRNGGGTVTDLVHATNENIRLKFGLPTPPRCLLYIDQFEEIYSLPSRQDARAFVDVINRSLGEFEIKIAFSLRADYYGHFQREHGLFPRSYLIDVPPLSESSLNDVLRRPAELLGAKFENEHFVPFISHASVGEPGALPLLADLMSDLWDRMRVRGDGILRPSDVKHIVQLGAGLAQRADNFVAAHPESENLIRDLFALKLCVLQQEGEPLRRRVDRNDCTEAEWKLIEELASAKWRLLVVSSREGVPTAEIAHEVLLKSWPRLQGWLQSERQFLVWRTEAAQARARVLSSPPRQIKAHLLSGAMLEDGQGWVRTRSAHIPNSLKVFVDISAKKRLLLLALGATAFFSVIEYNIAYLMIPIVEAILNGRIIPGSIYQFIDGAIVPHLVADGPDGSLEERSERAIGGSQDRGGEINSRRVVSYALRILPVFAAACCLTFIAARATKYLTWLALTLIGVYSSLVFLGVFRRAFILVLNWDAGMMRFMFPMVPALLLAGLYFWYPLPRRSFDTRAGGKAEPDSGS